MNRKWIVLIVCVVLAGCWPPKDTQEPAVYIVATSGYYHTETCPVLGFDGKSYSLSAATTGGYKPCPKCHIVPAPVPETWQRSKLKAVDQLGVEPESTTALSATPRRVSRTRVPPPRAPPRILRLQRLVAAQQQRRAEEERQRQIYLREMERQRQQRIEQEMIWQQHAAEERQRQIQSRARLDKYMLSRGFTPIPGGGGYRGGPETPEDRQIRALENIGDAIRGW